MARKINKELEEKIGDINAEMAIINRMGELRRSRSITVGTAFGGTTELMMRGNDGNVLWAVMQPVEVIELIHQLASNVGCHLALKPREDFSSWRNWKLTEQEKLHYNGFPPFVNDMAPAVGYGGRPDDPKTWRAGADSERIPEVVPAQIPSKSKKKQLIQANLKDSENANTVATKKTVDQRKSKRPPTAS